jgi:hypothetical protein
VKILQEWKPTYFLVCENVTLNAKLKAFVSKINGLEGTHEWKWGYFEISFHRVKGHNFNIGWPSKCWSLLFKLIKRGDWKVLVNVITKNGVTKVVLWEKPCIFLTNRMGALIGDLECWMNPFWKFSSMGKSMLKWTNANLLCLKNWVSYSRAKLD